jgi:S1 RNA binding domain protein
MAVGTGDILEGRVTGLTKFGAFVSLPDNKSGMVHISEISADYVREVSDHLSENQIVKVKILSVDNNGRISLSIKQVAPKSANSKTRRDEWQPRRLESNDFEDMMSKFKKDSEEKISRMRKGGENKRGY